VALAICIRCGNEKREPWWKCRRCGLDPMKDEETLVKSVYLSTGRYEDGNDQIRYETELLQVAEAIKNGENVGYEEGDLARLRKEKSLVEQFSPWRAVLRFFLPAILFIGGLITVYLALRYMRS
jgi:hypothetical protein